jgi:hypothetical protein
VFTDGHPYELNNGEGHNFKLSNTKNAKQLDPELYPWSRYHERH